jgi:capsular polysaccharide biosynthesis protein
MQTQKPQDSNLYQPPVLAAETEDQEDEIDLGALFYRLLEKIHWIILAALICAIAIGAVDYTLVKPIYQATSKIYIVGSDTAISLADLQIGSNLAADYQEVFKNWHVHELVATRLNLDKSYTALSGNLSISNPSNTHVIYVSYKSPDPEEAKIIADTYAQVAREFIAAKMDMREPNIFEEAKLPDRPITPRKTRDILIAFALGALAAIAVITVLFLNDDRIRTTEDVQKVGGLATLGMIPIQDLSKTPDPEPATRGGKNRKGRE